MKTVIFKNSKGEYMTTTEDNYNARIQNARQIHNMREFSTADEIIEYYCKWFGSKETDFIVID